MQLEALVGRYSERDKEFNHKVNCEKKKQGGVEARGGLMPIGLKMDDTLDFFPPIDLISELLENSKKGMNDGK